ncbi:MAG: BolA family protein [Gammaproteobacteria bacterium]
MNEQRVERIREQLLDELEPELLEIEDESHLHAGHAGARDGRGHFRVTVVSEAFTGLSRIARHRLVFEAVGTLMETDIHALTIQAFAPGEI